MTKADLITKIADQTGIDKADVANTLETFFVSVKDALISGDPVYVRGFGSFVTKQRAKKIARNISKGTTMEIPAHYIPSFKPAKEFSEGVRNSDKASGAA